MNIQSGSLRLFRLFGVNVFVHWSWALVAAAQIWRNTAASAQRGFSAHSYAFYTAEYLCLFLIVLIHEFGHALACKSVGGKADRIILFPLGGIAYVNPPQRPGALLWSIVAGPLVNVLFLPLTIIPAFLLIGLYGPNTAISDFAYELAVINAILLGFNMLPIYPLDGGQIFRALAWFVLGRGTSLIVAAVVGIVGAVLLALLAIYVGGIWLAAIVGFMGLQSFHAVKIGMAMMRMEKAPRHTDAVCPSCRQSPPVGLFWKCPCGAVFDTFATHAHCPACAKFFNVSACPLCSAQNPMPLWYSSRGFTVTLDPASAPVL